MNDEKEKWIEDVFQSMKGSQRAKPRRELLANIENRIRFSEAKIVTIRQSRYGVAAAVLILVLNLFALHQFTQNNELRDNEMFVSTQNINESIISNYKIYE